MMEDGGVGEDVWADPHSTVAYATMELFRVALSNAVDQFPDEPDAADVVSAYGTLEGESLGGLLAQPVTFQVGQPQGPNSCYWLATFEGGTFAGDFEPDCDPAELAQR